MLNKGVCGHLSRKMFSPIVQFVVSVIVITLEHNWKSVYASSNECVNYYAGLAQRLHSVTHFDLCLQQEKNCFSFCVPSCWNGLGGERTAQCLINFCGVCCAAGSTSRTGRSSTQLFVNGEIACQRSHVRNRNRHRSVISHIPITFWSSIHSKLHKTKLLQRLMTLKK